jgi:predicted regulator of amino acid metabolism with ACT domain
MMNSDASQRLAERAEKAALAPRHQVQQFFKDTAKEVLVALARNPNLQERDLLRLLERKDLPQEVLREIAAHKEAARHYAVKLALARHPKTPRLVSLPILKFLYLFDLVRVSQTPAVPADVKLVAEETILNKVEAIPRGEKISLARRGSGRVAAGLLPTDDHELIQAALANPFLSEAHLLRVLAREDLPASVVESIAHHEKWSHRYHLRLALIRNPQTPLRLVLAFLPDMAVNDLRDICLDHRMPEQVRRYVLAHCVERLNKKPSGDQRSE